MYCFEQLFKPELSDDKNSVEHECRPSFGPTEHVMTGGVNNLSFASTEHMLTGKANDLNVASTEHILTGKGHNLSFASTEQMLTGEGTLAGLSIPMDILFDKDAWIAILGHQIMARTST
jgi:hypothetical protein